MRPDPARYGQTILAAITERQWWRSNTERLWILFQQLAHRIQRSSRGMPQHGPQVEAQMAKSSYVIRVAGTVPLHLLYNFPQITQWSALGRYCGRPNSMRLLFGGLIDALRGVGLAEVRRESVQPPSCP